MANPVKKFSEEAEAAISVLRALVLSKKGASTVKSILSDFRELEGGPLMYKKFGYPNADEFLRASGEFVLQSRMGETVIFVKPSKESAHILKMVAAQRNTKTRKSGFAIQRQPEKRMGGNNWNPSAYNKMYSQMPYQTSLYTQKKYPSQPHYQYAQQQQPRFNFNPNNPLKQVFQNSPNNMKFGNNRNYSTVQNNYTNSQPKLVIPVKVVAPQFPQNVALNNQRYGLPEANNNNSAAKNLNKSPIKPKQQTPISNDLRPRLNDKALSPQQMAAPQQRQPSSHDLKNRPNQLDQQTNSVGRQIQQRNDLNSMTPSKQDVIDSIHRMVCEAVGSHQNYNAPAVAVPSAHTSPVAQPTRSVNTRLQITKVAPPSPVPDQETVSRAAYNSNGALPTRQEFTSPPQPLIHPLLITPPPTPTVPLPTLPGQKTLQDRLKINQQVDSSDLEKVSKLVTPQSPPPKTTDSDFKTPVSPLLPPVSAIPARTKESFSWNQLQATPIEMLCSYAKHNGFDRPIYKYYKLKNKRVQCRVTINGSTYSTYPNDYANEFEGQFAAAQNAIESIKRDEERNNYSVCLNSDFEIASKIFDLLLSCPHGMFSRNIPDAFRNAHQALLPDHWETIILSHAHMFSKEEAQGNTIMFANIREDNGSNGSVVSNTSEAKFMLTNVLVLPWEEKYWNLFITNPASTVEIWARLVGQQYSDAMDALITDIELSMMDESKPKAKTITVGEYYLVFTNDCWFRVRAEELDFENNICVCFYVDLGEWERVSMDKIYPCDAKYLKLPAQSVCFTLSGLEDFGDNPKAKPHIDNLICGKVCIAEVLTKQDEYEKESATGDARIQIILYDTSSEEDVNMNSIILKQVCEDTPVPELNRKSWNSVVITFVNEVGDLYCQLKDAAMVYIQKLITNLVLSKALEGKHCGLYKSKSAAGQQLYLVQDSKDMKWYRASLLAEESGSICRMLFVDTGVKKSVNVSNVYQLETLSVALSRYPPQAIRMKMFDIPEINDLLLSRLRALLKPGLTAMVKVVAYSTIPLVKVYMHAEPNNLLVCINESIRTEIELEMNSEVISDPRFTANENYSITSQEATDLSRHFSELNIEQPKVSSSPIPSQVVPKLAKYKLPAVGELFNVYVTIASSPNYFIVQPHSDALKLQRLMVDLQKYCMSEALTVPKDSVRQGEAYAGLNSDDGHWYRVLVVNILCGPSLIHVYFCDFGQIRIMDNDLLRILPQELRELPQQAVKAKLYGVQPINGDWTTHDAVRFQQLTVEKLFASQIRSIQADEFNPNDDIVELTLTDVSTDEDTIIHQVLVSEKRAVYTDK
ncbi:tudor domain-containing protein 7A isoform X2 [Topomyia yanbarensis]|uniref:tudor domain-containing protein 7A isoform X2 n=1 Tax=Topomyia yanbarensis TaxID=2498891 RepID=UPI00273BD3A7|nr:tudor domain-containing protein 7A isoform X2 [Topomyia yanbarensis]